MTVPWWYDTPICTVLQATGAIETKHMSRFMRRLYAEQGNLFSSTKTAEYVRELRVRKYRNG